MSVHKNAGGGYRTRWRDGDRNRSKTFDRKKDADDWDAEVRRLRQRGALAQLDAGKRTLADYVETVWGPQHAQHMAPHTRRKYANTWKVHLADELGPLPLRDLTPMRIRSWQERRDRAGAGRAALNDALTMLGGILQRAAGDGELSSNPVRLVKKLEARPSAEVRVLAPSVVERVRAQMGLRDATLVALLAYGGLRPSEALGLRWGDIKDRTIYVQRAIDGIGGLKTTKTGSNRTVKLLAPLAADLAAWRLAQGRPDDDQFVFLSPCGNVATRFDHNNWRSRTWRSAWLAAAAEAASASGAEPGAEPSTGPTTDKGKAAARAVGLDPAKVPRVYDLRHSAASLLLAEGRRVHYVARQLGHGPELTLRTYGHVIDELEDAKDVNAEDVIRAAREALGSLSVPSTPVTAVS